MKFIKLQKQKVGERKNKIYYKYVILVPNSFIEGLGWVDNQELKIDSVFNKGLLLFPIRGGE